MVDVVGTYGFLMSSVWVSGDVGPAAEGQAGSS